MADDRRDVGVQRTNRARLFAAATVYISGLNDGFDRGEDVRFRRHVACDRIECSGWIRKSRAAAWLRVEQLPAPVLPKYFRVPWKCHAHGVTARAGCDHRQNA